ncbi:MAG TPA: hypothetical protein VMF08_17645 [Candidatus Sulfotelmatobacter sp.]|nr:hypothetical protein [Candidatus Sulfotelmatobacter sp.]
MLAFILALGCSAFAQSDSLTTVTNVPAVEPVTARDFYNAGTELLAAKKFDEAEQMFLSALAAQDERVQPPALYNLAHARFADGLAALKRGPSAEAVNAQGAAADAEAGAAIQQGQAALAENDLSKLIAAYLAGRGARRDVRMAEEALRQAMQTYGETLRKWQQADDDFKSAAELNPADANASRNSRIVEQYIARLVDSIRQMQNMGAKLGDKHKKLNELLKQIGGRIPKPNLPPGAPGDKDKDEDGDIQPEDLQGLEETPTRTDNPSEARLSRDEAAQILNGIPLDSAQRLIMNEHPTNPHGNGRNW